MDQQVTGEENKKISRSKARHLRRKRLIAARRTLDNNLLPTQSGTDENIPGNQNSDNVLTKSKARRLRKKNKIQLSNDNRDSDSDNQTESSSNQNICESQSDIAVVSDSANIISSSSVEKVCKPDNLSDDNNTRLSSPKNSGLNTASDIENLDKVQNKIDTLKPDGSNISNKHKTQNNSALKNSVQSSSSYVDASYDTILNSDKDNTKFYKFSSENLEKESSSVNKNNCSESPQLLRSNKKAQNYKSETENASHTCDLRSNNSNNATFENDSDSASGDSNSSLRDHEIGTIQTDDSLESIVETAKGVLNSTELIENEKNLKISSNSKCRTGFELNAAVIDLTTYSSSELIISNDSTSYEFEEQEIIGDLISNLRSDIAQDKFYSTDWNKISNPESENNIRNYKKSLSGNLSSLRNQTSAENHSLPSTSTNNSVLPLVTNFEDLTKRQTVEALDYSRNFKETEQKMNTVEKTREQIKAEREAKKAAKALAKSKVKAPKSEKKTEAKCSKDTEVAESPERVQKVVEQNVVKKEALLPEKVTTKIESEKSANVDHKEIDSQNKAADGKSKRESKAERRAKQEAQRAAKEKQLVEKNKQKPVDVPKLKPPTKLPIGTETIVRKTLIDNNLHEVKLFKHLYHERELSLVNVPTLNSNIHPAIIRLGVQYANKVIIGSNARCVALLAAVKQLIQDFERPSQADFTRGLETSLQECAAYLHHCRPMAVSMQNALRHLKWQMSQISTTTSDEHAKRKLGNAIDTYIKEQIQLAGEAISNTIQTKISNGDIILTYAFSSLIHNILIDAHNAGKQFRVIIVDGRPWLEGREHLRRLAKHGIECSYVLINALSFIMPEVTKVFLGAHAILANGAVMSRAGTAQVALMAKAFNVPVLVACETHKSCERVQTDSFVYNEIGDADELANRLLSKSKKSPLLNWKTKKSLDLLNITFDVTPADLVSAVVTELAILPCTSIPVILRIKPSEI